MAAIGVPTSRVSHLPVILYPELNNHEKQVSVSSVPGTWCLVLYSFELFLRVQCLMLTKTVFWHQALSLVASPEPNVVRDQFYDGILPTYPPFFSYLLESFFFLQALCHARGRKCCRDEALSLNRKVIIDTTTCRMLTPPRAHPAYPAYPRRQPRAGAGGRGTAHGRILGALRDV